MAAEAHRDYAVPVAVLPLHAAEAAKAGTAVLAGIQPEADTVVALAAASVEPEAGTAVELAVAIVERAAGTAAVDLVAALATMAAGMTGSRAAAPAVARAY